MKTAWLKKTLRHSFARKGFPYLLTAVLVGLALSAGQAMAHGPSALALSYDNNTQTLKAEITHTSKTPGSHYVGKVEIIKNGKVVAVREYKSQPTPDTFSYEYRIFIGSNDTVEVKATCNRFGTIKQQLTSGPSKEPR